MPMNKSLTQKISSPAQKTGDRNFSILLFCIGALSMTDVNLIGRVSLAEVLAFTSLPFLYSGANDGFNENFKICISILMLMIVGIVVGDLYNRTPFDGSVRAIARPVFILFWLLFFVAVIRRSPPSVLYLIWGGVIAGVLNYFHASSFEKLEVASADTYGGVVFRVQPLIALLALAGAVYIYPKSKMMAVLAFLSGGLGIIIVGGSRSGILVWIASAGIIWAIKLLKSKNYRVIVLNKSRIYLLLVCGLLSIALVYYMYVYMAPKGYFGEEQRVKFFSQSRTEYGVSPLGFILSGRTQVYAAILGIMDRPIFGFGSWRHDLTHPYVVDAVARIGGSHGLLLSLMRSGGSTPAGHSIIFQCWVENGIIPAIAYVMLYVIVWKVFFFGIKYENRLTPWIVYSTVAFSWSFFFSPPGMTMRMQLGLFLALYVVFLDRERLLAKLRGL